MAFSTGCDAVVVVVYHTLTFMMRYHPYFIIMAKPRHAKLSVRPQCAFMVTAILLLVH